jgi:hypothetical protein
MTRVSTLHPAPAAPPARRTDTVELVERATGPRQIPTTLAIALIVLVSVVGGLTVYVLRLRIGGPAHPVVTERAPSP